MPSGNFTVTYTKQDKKLNIVYSVKKPRVFHCILCRKSLLSEFRAFCHVCKLPTCFTCLPYGYMIIKKDDKIRLSKTEFYDTIVGCQVGYICVLNGTCRKQFLSSNIVLGDEYGIDTKHIF